MSAPGLAAPNRIRCRRAAVARPCGGSSRLRGLVVDNVTFPCKCGLVFSSHQSRSQHIRRQSPQCKATAEDIRERHRLKAERRRRARGMAAREDSYEVERFWDKVDRSGGPDACWPWTAFRYASGYGQFGVAGVAPIRANRYAWMAVHGRIPDGLWVLHHCDNPPCCNPAHLFLGTAQDNVDDMVAKGRHRWGIHHYGNRGKPR
jgi:hypothetical protein